MTARLAPLAALELALRRSGVALVPGLTARRAAHTTAPHSFTSCTGLRSRAGQILRPFTTYTNGSCQAYLFILKHGKK